VTTTIGPRARAVSLVPDNVERIRGLQRRLPQTPIGSSAVSLVSDDVERIRVAGHSQSDDANRHIQRRPPQPVGRRQSAIDAKRQSVSPRSRSGYVVSKGACHSQSDDANRYLLRIVFESDDVAVRCGAERCGAVRYVESQFTIRTTSSARGVSRTTPSARCG
jgi:hypothetical protein